MYVHPGELPLPPLAGSDRRPCARCPAARAQGQTLRDTHHAVRQELREVKRLLTTSRLLTLTGSGRGGQDPARAARSGRHVTRLPRRCLACLPSLHQGHDAGNPDGVQRAGPARSFRWPVAVIAGRGTGGQATAVTVSGWLSVSAALSCGVSWRAARAGCLGGGFWRFLAVGLTGLGWPWCGRVLASGSCGTVLAVSRIGVPARWISGSFGVKIEKGGRPRWPPGIKGGSAVHDLAGHQRSTGVAASAARGTFTAFGARHVKGVAAARWVAAACFVVWGAVLLALGQWWGAFLFVPAGLNGWLACAVPRWNLLRDAAGNVRLPV